ncbi:hypothetical protein [Crateriforma conspicua]|uniref:hypothetical protein n=1 Tax=Crateriforma conspicua TaxID=2527996 RepID=UPI001187B2E0|nr:hypothetical protein [Crateriforma conspicua]QDV63427.1 hypothetical protein Mal65_25700 [Crateriforma conspicua]
MNSPLRMQPMFVQALPAEPDEAMRRIRRAIATEELAGQAVAAGHVVDFKIERAKRRFWSPHLSVHVCADDSAGVDQATQSEAYCRFSPRPEIWTMFMAVYFSAGCFIFAAAIWGYVQWFMGDSPWALVVIPVCLLVIVGLHIASLIGQGFSTDQMHVLRSRWERTVELAFAPESTLHTDVHPTGAPETDVWDGTESVGSGI